MEKNIFLLEYYLLTVLFPTYIFVNHFIFLDAMKYTVKKYIYLFIQSNYTLKLWLFIAWITIGSLMALFLLFWFGLDDFVVWTQLIWIFAVNLRSHSYRRIRRYMNIQMNINFTMEFILPKIWDGVIYKIVVCTLF